MAPRVQCSMYLVHCINDEKVDAGARSHSREHLQIRLWRRTPLVHEDEMNIRRTKPRPSTKVVWKTGCRWFYDHILRSEFNVHCRHSIDGSGNDGVGTKLSPQVVGATEEVSKTLKD